MNEQWTASIIAIIVVVGFFGLMLIILLGFVNVVDPTVAKLVGAVFGYVTAVLNPILLKYFSKDE